MPQGSRAARTVVASDGSNDDSMSGGDSTDGTGEMHRNGTITKVKFCCVLGVVLVAAGSISALVDLEPPAAVPQATSSPVQAVDSPASTPPAAPKAKILRKSTVLGQTAPAPAPAPSPPTSANATVRCCDHDTAECHACAVGETVEEFCNQRFGQGCEKISNQSCCSGSDAKCQSCLAKQSLDTFCSSREKHGQKVEGCACKLMEQDMDYPGGTLYQLPNVPSADVCCNKCRDEPQCTTWTYHSWGHWCRLKSQVELKRIPNKKGFISGMPRSDAQTIQIKSLYGICLRNVATFNFTDRRVVELENCNSTGMNRPQHFSYKRFEKRIMDAGGWCMDAIPELGQRVYMSPCSESKSQEWDFYSEGVIKSVSNDFCLRAVALETEGSAVVLSACAVADDRKWAMWIITPVHIPPEKQYRSPTGDQKRKHSLYCFASMLPWGGELALLKMQLSEKRSLFECEGFDVYSNVIVDLGGYATKMIYTDLHCPYGKTVINTFVFIHLWRQVIRDATFLKYDWTVKVDPDAAFLPSRLHDVIRGPDHAAANANNGMLLVNCKFGLHGPIEVMSRRALEHYGNHYGECGHPPQEDVYLRACMAQIGVFEKNQFDLLAEAHCASLDWFTCQSPFVAFHPFKDADGYKQCLWRADHQGSWR